MRVSCVWELPCQCDHWSAAFGSILAYFIVGEQSTSWNKTCFVVLKRGREDPSSERAHDGTDGGTDAIFF